VLETVEMLGYNTQKGYKQLISDQVQGHQGSGALFFVQSYLKMDLINIYLCPKVAMTQNP
jgi:hypothetical protein